ncbi:MAG: GNAT family N-acetyltransferase, partial [Actinomycetes bacterium]
MLVLAAPLVTDRLRLRVFTPADLDDVTAYQSSAEVVRYLYWEVRGREEVRALLEERSRRDRLEREGDRLVLAVERVDDGRVIGEVTLAWASQSHQQGEIGFVLHPDVHGQGYASEAATALLDLAF